MIVFERVEVQGINRKVLNYSVQLTNDYVTDTVYNAVMELYEDVDQIMIHIKVNTPANDKDDECRKEFMKTTINTKKLMNGAQGNFIVRTFLENVHDSIDFTPALPMKAVRLVFIMTREALKILQGTYRLTNFTVSDKYVPFVLQSKLLVVTRVVGKVVNSKSPVQLFTYRLSGSVNKTLF